METVKEDILQRKKKMEEEKCSLQEAEQKLAAIKDKISKVEEEAGPVKVHNISIFKAKCCSEWGTESIKSYVENVAWFVMKYEWNHLMTFNLR